MDEPLGDLDRLLDSKQQAAALRLSPKTVYNLRARGVLIPRAYLGRRPLYDLDESLERYNRLWAPRPVPQSQPDQLGGLPLLFFGLMQVASGRLDVRVPCDLLHDVDRRPFPREGRE